MGVSPLIGEGMRFSGKGGQNYRHLAGDPAGVDERGASVVTVACAGLKPP